ncbi:tRNA-dihydrouridine synthase [bacterium]|nr:tRNA-dihydrouridine synthase [bacterium]
MFVDTVCGDALDFYLAPLAEITSKEFRILCYEGGAGSCFSEMISAKAVTLRNRKTISLSEIDEREPRTVLQFFGGDPEVIREAAEKILERVTPAGIDINAGCPVRKVVAARAGSALMDDPERLGKIVKTLRKVTNLPLSVKIRKGFKTPNYERCAAEAVDSGADMLTVHPRLRTEMFSGTCDFNVSIELAEKLTIPVIHSGDIRQIEDLEKFKGTKIAGIMVGRGALGKPWIFRELKGETVTPEEKKEIMRKHFQYYLDLGTKVAQTMIRRHASWYSAGFHASADFRNSIFNPENDTKKVIEIINNFFGLNL